METKKQVNVTFLPNGTTIVLKNNNPDGGWNIAKSRFVL